MHKLKLLLGPLRVFDAVARSGSMGRAAEVLHVTPGAVSQQIKSLERSLGTALFEKSGREAALTQAGYVLARRARDAFDRLENAVAEAGERASDRRLRLTVMPTFAFCWLLPRLADFYARHSDIDVEISTNAKGSEVQLDQNDFVVRHGVGQWTDVAFDHVFDDAFCPVCSPETAAQIKVPEDVFRFNLLHSVMRPMAWRIWMDAAGLGERDVPRGLTLGSASMCYQGAVDGLGVAIAQLDYVASDLRTGRLVKPLDLVARTESGYYFVCDPLKTEKHAVAAFRAWLRATR